MTSIPTAAPTASPPATALASPTSPPTNGPTAAPRANPLTADVKVVRAHGYSPSKRYVSVPDGFGNTLYAWHGTCAGSADGYCQIMLFFLGTRYLGTDTAQASTNIQNYQPVGVGSIAVTYSHYASTDPLCCPSLPPVTITYRWNGTHLIASGTPPGH